jgi:hypothetical protein
MSTWSLSSRWPVRGFGSPPPQSNSVASARRRSGELRAGCCWSWMIPRRFSTPRSWPARPRRARSPTSTDGGSGGLRIRSDTSGRSAGRSAHGRPPPVEEEISALAVHRRSSIPCTAAAQRRASVRPGVRWVLGMDDVGARCPAGRRRPQSLREAGTDSAGGSDCSCSSEARVSRAPAETTAFCARRKRRGRPSDPGSRSRPMSSGTSAGLFLELSGLADVRGSDRRNPCGWPLQVVGCSANQ